MFLSVSFSRIFVHGAREASAPAAREYRVETRRMIAQPFAPAPVRTRAAANLARFA
jgi:hypothetical protein